MYASLHTTQKERRTRGQIQILIPFSLKKVVEEILCYWLFLNYKEVNNQLRQLTRNLTKI